MVSLRYRLLILAGSHFVNDMLNGLLVAILPLLSVMYHLNYTEIAVLILVNGVSSGLLQPLLTALLEPVTGPWILCLSPLMLAAGCYAFSVTDSLGWLIAAMSVGSLGSSLFHPEANRTIHNLSSMNAGVFQSTFQVGGNLGMACAPLGVWYLHRFSLHGSWILLLLALPVMFFTMSLFARGPEVHRRIGVDRGAAMAPPPAASYPVNSMATLVAVVTFRALVGSGVVSFLPLFLLTTGRINNDHLWLVSLLYLTGGAVGTWGGGWLIGRLEERTAIQASLLLSVPFAVASVFATGAALLLCLFLFGLCLMSTFSITVLYAQKLMPGRVGLASSLVIGLTGGISGVFTVVFGLVADRIGIQDIIMILFALPFVGWVLSLRLPKHHKKAVQTGASFAGN